MPSLPAAASAFSSVLADFVSAFAESCVLLAIAASTLSFNGVQPSIPDGRPGPSARNIIPAPITDDMTAVIAYPLFNPKHTFPFLI
ncbi:hypothetical protein D1872_276960 [compost metagenome]